MIVNKERFTFAISLPYELFFALRRLTDPDSRIKHLMPLLALLLLPTQASFLLAKSAITLRPCHIREVKQDLRCGTFDVYEDRTRAQGRKIPLNIVVLPATGKNPAPDPLFSFSGGPGEAATNDVELILHDWKDINVHRDIVLVDVRGTGQSNGLPCVENDLQGSVQALLESFYSAKDLTACRKNLESHADLRFYNTSLAVDDLDDVRSALGYGKINIFGASYGTRVVLVYLRQHPDHVRTATLWDVSPTNARMPLFFASYAQAAFDGLVSYCRKETQCGAAFPDTDKEFQQILQQTEEHPVEVQAEDATRKKAQFVLTRAGVAQTVRFMLYSPKTAALIPLQVHLAAQGEWRPLAQSAYNFASQLTGALSEGYYLGVTCSEDVPFFTTEEGEKAAQGTFLGDFRARVQKEACATWPSLPANPHFLDPVQSDVPSLLIEGDLDPVTPPGNAEWVSKTLPHSKRVVVPRGSHDFEGMENSHCIDQIIGQLLETGDEAKIDVNCVTAMRPAPFAMK